MQLKAYLSILPLSLLHLQSWSYDDMNIPSCFVCSTYSLILYANISATLVYVPMLVSKMSPSHGSDRLPLAISNN